MGFKKLKEAFMGTRLLSAPIQNVKLIVTVSFIVSIRFWGKGYGLRNKVNILLLRNFFTNNNWQD